MQEMKLANPYIDELNEMSKAVKETEDRPYFMAYGRSKQYPMYDWVNRKDYREDLVKKYAWAIPNEEAIRVLCKYSPIIEIGAGTGYWAHLIEQAGGDILAFDEDPYTNQWCDGSKYFPVQEGCEGTLMYHPDRTLLLCWPPYQHLMAQSCLEFYEGDHIIYVGESYGCTGSDEFENILVDTFIEVEQVDIPQYSGIHDYLRVFERRK